MVSLPPIRDENVSQYAQENAQLEVINKDLQLRLQSFTEAEERATVSLYALQNKLTLLITSLGLEIDWTPLLNIEDNCLNEMHQIIDKVLDGMERAVEALNGNKGVPLDLVEEREEEIRMAAEMQLGYASKSIDLLHDEITKLREEYNLLNQKAKTLESREEEKNTIIKDLKLQCESLKQQFELMDGEIQLTKKRATSVEEQLKSSSEIQQRLQKELDLALKNVCHYRDEVIPLKESELLTNRAEYSELQKQLELLKEEAKKYKGTAMFSSQKTASFDEDRLRIECELEASQALNIELKQQLESARRENQSILMMVQREHGSQPSSPTAAGESFSSLRQKLEEIQKQESQTQDEWKKMEQQHWQATQSNDEAWQLKFEEEQKAHQQELQTQWEMLSTLTSHLRKSNQELIQSENEVQRLRNEIAVNQRRSEEECGSAYRNLARCVSEMKRMQEEIDEMNRRQVEHIAEAADLRRQLAQALVSLHQYGGEIETYQSTYTTTDMRRPYLRDQGYV